MANVRFEVRPGARVVRNRIQSFEVLAEAATPWRHVREGPAPSQHRVG